MIDVGLEFLGWLLMFSWIAGIIFSMAVMDLRNRPVGVGFLLGLLLGPLGLIVACALPSMTEEDLIRREARRLRIEREAKKIIEREDAGIIVRHPRTMGISGWEFVMIGAIVVMLLMFAAVATMLW